MDTGLSLAGVRSLPSGPANAQATADSADLALARSWLDLAEYKFIERKQVLSDVPAARTF